MNLRYTGIVDVFTKLGKKGFSIWLSGKRKEGEYKYWRDNGQIMEHSFYKNGELEGEYKEWDVRGKLLRHHIYKDGRKIKDLL